MTQFLIRRIFWAIFLFLVATIITYLIFWVIPSDPAALAAGKSATPADIARVSHLLHLDEPIWKQYLRFVWQLVRHGSLGESFVNRQPVRTIISKDAPVTASLSGAARAAAYAKLDQQLMSKYAPVVPYLISTNRYFVSSRTKNWIYSSYFGSPYLNALAVG